MQPRQCDVPRPNDPPAVATFRSRHQLSIATGAAVLAMTLAACGSGNARRGTDPQATPTARTARQNHPTSPPDTVRLPDLTDPATRKQFACGFADGYFTEPQAPRDNTCTRGPTP
jgi:glucose/arabinose dehydrogenase